jgi:hypothetical protein
MSALGRLHDADRVRHPIGRRRVGRHAELMEIQGKKGHHQRETGAPDESWRP